MSTSHIRAHLIPRLCLASAVLSLSAASAVAAARNVAGEIQARYEQERAICLSGQSNQDRTTCLKEAGAAREEARRGQLDSGDRRLRSNAKERCAALTGDDAVACEARMDGLGKVSGSVDGGGVVREIIIRKVEPAPGPEATQR